LEVKNSFLLNKPLLIEIFD